MWFKIKKNVIIANRRCFQWEIKYIENIKLSAGRHYLKYTIYGKAWIWNAISPAVGKWIAKSTNFDAFLSVSAFIFVSFAISICNGMKCIKKCVFYNSSSKHNFSPFLQSVDHLWLSSFGNKQILFNCLLWRHGIPSSVEWSDEL